MMVRSLAIAVVVVVSVSASADQSDRSGNAEAVYRYFRDYNAELVARHIRALEEPVLKAATRDASAEIYRLIALPAFAYPISVRINIRPSGAAAATVRSSTYLGTGSPQGKLAIDRAMAVSPNDVVTLKTALFDNEFWALPNDEVVASTNGIAAVPVCADGTLLLIEAVSRGEYYSVERLCRGDDVRPIVEVFKRIARPYLPKDVDEYVP